MSIAKTVLISAVVSVCVTIGGKIGSNRLGRCEKIAVAAKSEADANRYVILVLADILDQCARKCGVPVGISREEMVKSLQKLRED